LAGLGRHGMLGAMSELEPLSAPRALLPPHLVLRDFLPADTAAAILAYAQANEARFTPVQGYDPNVPARAERRSLSLRDIGPFRALLRDRLAPLQEEITAALGLAPFQRANFEFQMLAHGDGTYIARHIDIRRDRVAVARRAITGVYYMHAEPQGFQGGALRLHDPQPHSGDGGHIDLAPAHNTCIFFPSTMAHEVMPIAVPSGRFADARFSVNCWFHRVVQET
jgi:SM-20-related protein